jgi:hypothetical protein
MSERYLPSGEISRHAVSLDADLSNEAGHQRANIINLSAEGCCLILWQDGLRVGDKVGLRPYAKHTLIGVVRWVKARRAGLRFVRPLGKATLERLAKFDGGATALIHARQLPSETTPQHL